MISNEDSRRLVRWQRCMVATFVGMWVYLGLVVAADLLLRPPARVVQLALLPALVLAIGGVWLQFSARCPACGYRLGRQSRLVVPERCRSCGLALRRPDAAS